MTRSKHIPKRRFLGFEGEWEQEKFGKIATIINGRAYSQHELLSKGKYKVLRVGNFYTNESWYYSNMELDSKYYANNGDLLYTWSATFGPHIWGGDKVIYHYHIWKVELSDRIDKQYTLQLLEKDKSDILSNKNGSTMVHVTKDGMENKILTFPEKIEEQTKIGTFLRKLDQCITLHQNKLDKLKNLKKSYLAELFPEEGERVPKRRFPGFEGEWEEKKLGDVTTTYSGGTPTVSNKDYYCGDIPFIRSSEINSFFTELFLTNLGLEKSSAKLVKKGDILYALYGATSGEVGLSKIDGAINQAILCIVPDEKYSSDFIMQWLRFKKQNILDKFLQGGQGNLSGAIVKDIKVYFPDYLEQLKIGIFFQKLDRSISLQQQKLNKLKDLKKAYLNELFV